MTSGRKYFLFYMILFFQINFSLAQQQRIDSIKNQLPHYEDKSELVEQFIIISRDYTYLNPDSAYSYATQAYQLASEIEYKKGIANSYQRLGVVKHVKGDFQEALIWLDSALELNKKLGDVENELAVINDLAMVHTKVGNEGTALEMHFQGLEIAEEQKLYDLAGSFNGNIGINLLRKGLYDSARVSFENALNYFKLNNDKPKQSLMLNNIGTVYHYEANYAKAFMYYKDALNLATSINYTRVSNLAGGNAALIYKRIDSPEKAIEYLLPVLDSYQKIGLKVEVSGVLQNIATFYEELENYEEAINYGEQAMKIRESIDSYNLSYTYTVIGRAQYKMGNKELGLDYLNKALKDAVKHENKRAQIHINLFLANDHIEKKEDKKALVRLTDAIALLDSVDLPEDWQEAYLLLSQVLRNLGELDRAYSYLELANTYLDTLKSEERVNALMRSAIEFETEKRKQELVQLQQEGEIKDLQVKEKSFYLVLLLIGTLVIILIAFVINLYSKQKRQQLVHSNQLIQQKLLRVQLNPHFIFNALNAIQEQVVASNTKSASKFLANFSRLMRQILENSRSEFIPLSQEIEMLEDYLSLQRLRKPFIYTITCQEELDVESLAIPPMFAQPFVENAVEHGISEDISDGEIHIHFALENESITLTIKDNGEGIKTSVETQALKHQSLATLITEERVMVLKDNLKKKIAFKVEDLSQGTQVVFHLPFELL